MIGAPNLSSRGRKKHQDHFVTGTMKRHNMLSPSGSRSTLPPRAGLLLLLVAAGGCPITPKYVRPEVPLPPSWSESNDARLAKAAVDLAWWKSFNDPVLDRLVELAYQQNLPLEIAALRILEARAQLGIARAQQYPNSGVASASAGLVGLHSHQDPGNDVTINSGTFPVGFDAQWEVDIWGKFRRGVRAARAAYLGTVASYDDALVSLTGEVARTYAEIRTYQVLIALSRENTTVQEEGLRIAESRFRNGATSQLDVAQATTLLESTRATIPEYQVNLQQAENALCTLLGRAPGCAPPLLTGAEVIPTPPGQVAVGLPTELIRRRPDIRESELQAIAQCDRVGVARTDLFPKFTLTGSITSVNVTRSGAPAALSMLLNFFNAGSFLYSIAGSLLWPILSYPEIVSNIRVQDARLQESLVDYKQTVIKAAQEVEDGIVGFLREQEAATFSQNAANAALTSVKLSLTQYREGAVDYERVLESQRQLLQAQTSLARTRSSIVTSLIALYKALGGGWEVRQGQPVVRDDDRVEMQKRTNWGGYFDKPPQHSGPR
jgi:NodT family efflux transporter outer membrane factor (OMF) lipoprotein